MKESSTVSLQPVSVDPLKGISLYRVTGRELLGVSEFISSTPESRSICNDPAVLGLDYTNRLGQASARTLSVMKETGLFSGSEGSTSVLTILRGGLNFELRAALGSAFGWNRHNAWFISAQRELYNAEDNLWRITEDSYRKLFVKGEMDVVFGDVVATGTSLKYGLERLTAELHGDDRYRSVTFFTIGAPVTAEIISEWKRVIEEKQRAPVACSVIYFEGVFAVAEAHTPLSIKIDGTDLIRRDSLLAPEFVESQYESPTFPMERCTIYDAGSRSFFVAEYLTDVIEYWEQIEKQAKSGITFEALLKERVPELDGSRFGKVDLLHLTHGQLEKLQALRLA